MRAITIPASIVSILWPPVRSRGLLCFALGSIGILGSGCSSGPAGLAATEAGLKVRPATILVTPDQALKHGLWTEGKGADPVVAPKPLPDSSAVLTPAGVKVYSLGRYEDPADPDLLHEAHLVYRRETAARWNLQPGPAGQVLIGNRVAPADPKAGPLQVQELQGIIQQLRREQAENRAALEKLRKLLEQAAAPTSGGSGK